MHQRSHSRNSVMITLDLEAVFIRKMEDTVATDNNIIKCLQLRMSKSHLHESTLQSVTSL